MINYESIKDIIFKLDPETAHNVLEFGAKNMDRFCPKIISLMAEKNFVLDNRFKQDIFGVEFLNPVGLAAGFDKNMVMPKTLTALGFGFLEFGTITPKPQNGNPKPRLFRYPNHRSIQNAMGFNNDGMDEVKKRVQKIYPFITPLGANIGKNKTTPQDDAIRDYEKLIKQFEGISDYLVINISSPNTPGLRDLQNEDFIKEIFQKAISLTTKPVLLKIAPDMEIDDAKTISNIAIENGAKGLIATNTTIDYSLLDGAKKFGGLSGEILRNKSYTLFKELAKDLFGKTTLISVGGIDSGEEAYRRIRAGASLVQVLSALIFEGPALIKNINLELLELLKEDGFSNISEAIGSDLR